MTLYLHIGSHKTGTTSIQRFLSSHRDDLALQGIWYPRISELLTHGKDSPSHLNIARSLDSTDKPKFFTADQLNIIFKTLAAKSKHFNTTIISAEAFWRIGFTKPPEGKFNLDDYNALSWESKQKNIIHIRNLLGEIDEATIVATLRERSSYIQSSYSEFILATQYRKGIQRFISYTQHISDYKRQLDSWSKYFPTLVLSYEKMCEENSLPVEFLRSVAGAAATSSAADKQPKIFNTGHPIACVVFKRYLNGLTNMSKQKRAKIYNKAHRRFNRCADKEITKALGTINSWLTDEEIHSLRRRFSADDDFIRKFYCKDFFSAKTASDGDHQSNTVPITKADEYLCLGWMLSRLPARSEWFSCPQ